jgi:hypothetical protein
MFLGRLAILRFGKEEICRTLRRHVYVRTFGLCIYEKLRMILLKRKLQSDERRAEKRSKSIPKSKFIAGVDLDSVEPVIQMDMFV